MNNETKTRGVLSRLLSHAPRWLAVAAGMGYVSMAMGENYLTVWSQNFDDAEYLSSSDYKDNWSNSRPIVTREGITSTGSGENSVSLVGVYNNTDGSASSCLSFYGSSRNSIRGAYYTFPKDVFDGLTDYIFSFDVYMTGGGYLNVSEAGGGAFSFLTLTGGSASDTTSDDDLIVIHIPKNNNDGYCSLYLKKDWTQDATYWNDCTPSIAATSSGGLLHSERGKAPNAKSPGTSKYWHRITVSANETDGIYVTVTRLVDSVTLLDNVYAGEFNTLKQLNIVSKVGHVAEYIAVDNFVLQTPAAEGTPDQPTITETGGNDDIKTVTVALADGAVAGTKLYVSIGSQDNYVEYTAPIQIQSTTYVYAKATSNNLDSNVVSEYVVAGSIPTPTGSITGVDGTRRTVTFVSDYDIQYKTSENDEFVDSATKIFTVDASTTYYVRAKNVSSVDNTVTFYSDVLTLAVEAGTSVKLAAPSAYYRSGVNFVTVYAPQSSVVASPMPSIKYTVTSKTGTFEKTTSNGYATLDCGDEDGAVVTCWATCDGYEDSDTYQVTLSNLNAHNYACIYTLDYAALFTANTSWSPAYGSLLYVDSGEAIQRCYLSVNGDSSIISDPIFYNYEKNNAGNVTQRHQNGTWNDIHALYTYTTQKTPVITKLKDGDIINVIATDASASTGLANSAVATSSGYDKYFDVTAQDVDEDGYGYAIFSTALKQNIFAIRIYRPAAASLDGVGCVTFAEALAAAETAGGGTITLNANVTGDVVIPIVGISIVCGDYSISGNVTGAENIVVSYDENTKTYTSAADTTASITIPALSNMTLVSVTVGGEEIQATSAGVYTVEAGSTVVVTFAPSTGYMLDTTTVTLENVTDAVTVTPPTSTYIMATAVINNETKNYASISEAVTEAKAAGVNKVTVVGAVDSNLSLDGAYAGMELAFETLQNPSGAVWVGTEGSEYNSAWLTWSSIDGTNCGISQNVDSKFYIATGENQTGRVRVTSGLYHAMWDMNIASALGAKGYLTIDGGRVETASWMFVGGGENSESEIEINDGELVLAYREGEGGEIDWGNFCLAGGKNSDAKITINGGRFRTYNMHVSDYWRSDSSSTASGEVEVNDGGVFEVKHCLNLGRGPGAQGTVNLNGGGTLKTAYIRCIQDIDDFTSGAQGSGVINLNGGTIVPLAETADFMPANDNLTVALGSVAIDTAYDVTVGATITAATGVSTPALTKKGAGALTLASLPAGTKVSVVSGSVTVPQSCGAVAASGTLRTASGDNYVFTVGSTMDPGATSATTYDDQTAAEAAATAVTVSVPAAVAEQLTDDQEAAYVAMFEAKAVESTTESGKYVVTVDFTEAAEAEIKAAENAITVVDGATPQVTVAAKPGLYYFVKAGTAADSLAVDGTGTLATGDSVTLDMPLPDSGVKYYKVVASPTSSL